MNRHTWTDPAPAPAHGRMRSYVLELVRNSDEPGSVVDIAHATGLHRNTARFHLDGLVEAGRGRRRAGAAGRAGRPAHACRVQAPHAPPGPPRYRPRGAVV